MDTERKRGRCRNFLCAVYLLLALALLGRVCATCYPETVRRVRAYLGGRTAQAVSALSDVLSEGRNVREVFSRITGDANSD